MEQNPGYQTSTWAPKFSQVTTKYTDEIGKTRREVGSSSWYGLGPINCFHSYSSCKTSDLKILLPCSKTLNIIESQKYQTTCWASLEVTYIRCQQKQKQTLISTLNIVSQHGTLIRKSMSRKLKWSNAELAVLHLTDTTTPVAWPLCWMN